MILRHYDRPAGYDVLWLKGFSTAWDECIELQCTPKEDWIANAFLNIQEEPRTDVVVFNDVGEVVGGLLVREEHFDPHVTSCLSVIWQYVLPEYRNKKVSTTLMRYVKDLAKQKGFRVISFTHRKGDWCYETIYKRL